MVHPTVLAFRRPPGIVSPLSPFESASTGSTPAVLTPPTLSLLPGSDRGSSISDRITNDPTPGIRIDLDPSYEAENHIHIELASDTGGGFGAYSEIVDHELTTGDIAAPDFDETLSTLPDGVHRFRARMSLAGEAYGHANSSDYSDVLEVTQNQALGAITSVSITGGGDIATVQQPSLTVTDGAVLNGNVCDIRHPVTGLLWGTATADGTDESNGFMGVDIDLVTLPVGQHTASVTIRDGSENLTADLEYTFTVTIPLMDFSVPGNSQYAPLVT